MPRRLDSDEESKPKRRKATTDKSKTNASAKTKKAAEVTQKKKNNDSIVSAWAKRKGLEDVEGIDDVDVVSPQRQRLEAVFQVEDSLNFVC